MKKEEENKKIITQKNPNFEYEECVAFFNNRKHINGVLANGKYINKSLVKSWYKDGLFHREDGPAVEYNRGQACYWYVNGESLTKEEFDIWRVEHEAKSLSETISKTQNNNKIKI